MTLQELHERIGWQLDGRLQTRYENNWIDVKHGAPPSVCDPPEVYRRRPDPPPMPDEVWISDNQKPESDGAGDTFTAHAFMCGAEAWHGGKLIRYIRAGAVIPVSQIEWRHIAKSSTTQLNLSWRPCGPVDVEYRIKP